MSALFGIERFDGASATDSLARQRDSLAPFGRDAVDEWVSGAVGLGFRLYDLLPEDRHDRQPVETATGRYVVAADVRLSERDDLAAQLGLTDAARLSDSAIMAAAIDRWHDGAFDRIYGAFAVAAWDTWDRRWLLARDHLGQKPLFFLHAASVFAFASMPVGLQVLPETPRDLDERQMQRFLRLLPPEPGRTHYRDIRRVDPGHLAVVTRAGVTASRYWKPDLTPLRLDSQEAYEAALGARLDSAVASALRGAETRGVAVQMSGGFDSTTVGAVAAEILSRSGGRLTALTSVPRPGFEDALQAHEIADESGIAEAVAAMHSNMTLVKVQSGQPPTDRLDLAAGQYGQPLFNLCNKVWSDAIDAEARRRGVGVMLHGSTGNATISESGVVALAELASRGRLLTWLGVARGLVRNGWMRWRGVLWNSVSPFLPPNWWVWGDRVTGRQPVEVARYSALRQDLWRTTGEDAHVRNAAAHPLDRIWAQDHEQTPRDSVAGRLTLLTDDLGSHDKGVLAAHGLDYRDPTADRRLIEFSLRVPVEVLIRAGQPRALLRGVMRGRLPDAVLDNRKKGYQAADWRQNLAAGKASVAAEIERIEMFEPSARLLDVERLRRLVQDWPDPESDAWRDPHVVADYRHALLRGISAAAFMRKAAGSNY